MRRIWKIGMLAAVFAALEASCAFAGQWQENSVGYWYQEDDGTYPVSEWKWIDGNGDGISECYYFDGAGYMASDTWIEGSRVNQDGAWVVNGQVQVQKDFAAARRDGDAREVFEAVIRQNKDTYNMDADYTMNMQMGSAGETIDTNMVGRIQMSADPSGENLKYRMDMDMNLLGITQHALAFYTDGWYYYDVEGQKFRMEMPIEDMIATAQASNLMADQDLSYISDISMVTDEDSTTIYFTADAEKIMNQSNQILAMSGMPASGDEMEVSIGQYKGEFTVDDQGNYTQERVLMDMTMESAGESMDMHIFMEMNINAMGSEVSFELPSTEGYVDFAQYLQEAVEHQAA